jgi:hypothetical protein
MAIGWMAIGWAAMTPSPGLGWAWDSRFAEKKDAGSEQPSYLSQLFMRSKSTVIAILAKPSGLKTQRS